MRSAMCTFYSQLLRNMYKNFHKVTLKLMTGNKSLCLYAGVVRLFLFFEAGFGIAMVKCGGNEI